MNRRLKMLSLDSDGGSIFAGCLAAIAYMAFVIALNFGALWFYTERTTPSRIQNAAHDTNMQNGEGARYQR